MKREEIVIDASVVTKWFVEEKYLREVRFLRDSYAKRLINPTMLGHKVPL